MLFGEIKGFNKVLIKGYNKLVKAQLKTAIEILCNPPKKSLKDTTRFINEGTKAF